MMPTKVALAAAGNHDDEESTPPHTPPRMASPPRFHLAKQKSPPIIQSLSPQFGNLSLKESDNESETTTAATTSATGTVVGIEDGSRQDGSRAKPYLIFADLQTSTARDGYIPLYVSEMKRREWKRPGIHLAKFICILDVDFWTCHVPEAHEFPQYKDRCLLVKRPLHNWWWRHPKLYYAKLKCQDTKEAHDALIKFNEQSVGKRNMEYAYDLVVFAREVSLSNTHFTGHVTDKLKRHFLGNLLERNNPKNEWGSDLRQCHVYWEIAFKDGGIPLAGDSSDEEMDKKSAF